MNTFKHILSDYDKTAFLAAWRCYVNNQTKWCKTMIHLHIDRNIFEDIYLKQGIYFCWQHQNQTYPTHSNHLNY